MKINKTNAARLLDKVGIEYELIHYDVDQRYLAAAHTAEVLGQNVGQIFKTIVLRGDRTGVLVCEVPGNAEVDLKKAARASGNKSVAPLPLKELLSVTGYVRGGCSPLAMKRKYPTYIDRGALEFEHIYISAGVRGLEIKIAPQDLAIAAEASFEDIVSDRG